MRAASNKNLTEKQIKVWSVNRDKNGDIFHNWLSVGGLAKCNLEHGARVMTEMKKA